MSRRASPDIPVRPPMVATLTLGCKLNQAETQQAARELQRHGCVTSDRPTRADAYLINTCTITHVADRKARRLIRLANRLSPNAPVIVTGCYAERDAAALADLGQVQIVGNERKHEVADALLAAIDEIGSDSASLGDDRVQSAGPGRLSRSRKAATTYAHSASSPMFAGASGRCPSTRSWRRPRSESKTASRKSC